MRIVALVFATFTAVTTFATLVTITFAFIGVHLVKLC
jgi:hypothetical protein